MQYGLFHFIDSTNINLNLKKFDYILMNFTLPNGSIDETYLSVLFKRNNNDNNYTEHLRYINTINNLIDNNDIELALNYDESSKTYKTNFIVDRTFKISSDGKIINSSEPMLIPEPQNFDNDFPERVKCYTKRLL